MSIHSTHVFALALALAGSAAHAQQPVSQTEMAPYAFTAPFSQAREAFANRREPVELQPPSPTAPPASVAPFFQAHGAFASGRQSADEPQRTVQRAPAAFTAPLFQASQAFASGGQIAVEPQHPALRATTILEARSSVGR